MRYTRHIEDVDGNLIEVLVYCCALCYADEPDSAVAELPGGWWPCLDDELESPEACRICGELIGAVTEAGVDDLPAWELKVRPAEPVRPAASPRP